MAAFRTASAWRAAASAFFFGLLGEGLRGRLTLLFFFGSLPLAGLFLAVALGGQSSLYGGISGITLRAERRQPRGGRVDGVGGG